MTKRVPVTPETLERIKDFARGLDVTYDVAINLLLNMVESDDEEDLLAGFRLRDELENQRKSGLLPKDDK